MHMGAKILQNPATVKIASERDFSQIQQKFVRVSMEQKLAILNAILIQEQAELSVIFCNTIEQTQKVCQGLKDLGFAAQALHGKMEQRERSVTLVSFSHGSCNVLVVTDVAARGLDIKELSLVVNFDMTREPEVYVHRIGRTGRQDRQGTAWTLVTPAEDYKLKKLTHLMGCEPTFSSIPESLDHRVPRQPLHKTLHINLGKKAKIRPADILGALTRTGSIKADMVGKIDILPFDSYVALKASVALKAKAVLEDARIKNLRSQVRWLRSR